jgi:TP901 family phage tail tape measure protein
MSRNKVIFDVLADSSQYKAQMQSIAKTTDDTSKTITTAFALSAAAIGSTLAAFAKYETQLIKVGKTANLGGKELDDFGKDIVALSSKIPLSTNELLELSASAAQLGVKGKDNILKFTETVAKLGTATNITGEEGSQQIARLLNITGEGVGTVDRFANVITRLGNNVAATEAEILSMASRVGKATAQFDLGTTAVLGISAALKEIGIEAELGGSAVGRTFFAIQDAVYKGGDAMKTFSAITGKSSEELKTIFQTNATNAFQLFIDSLHKLPAEQVATAMSSMGLEGVRLIEVVGTLAKRSELLATNLAMANDEAIKQTALDQEFNRAVVSLENSFKFMVTEVKNLAASIGQDLSPAASELIKDITGMIKGIRDFNEATGGAITTSIVMAAKVAALVLAVNKLQAVLVTTGIFSGTLAVQLGLASKATAGYNLSAALGVTQNKLFALSFTSISAASKSALVAIKNFQVGLGALVAGLYIAYEAGTALGKVIGKLGEANNSEQDLLKTQKELNKMVIERRELEQKANAGDTSVNERLANLDKEIKQRQGLIAVIQKEVNVRAGAAAAVNIPSLPEVPLGAEGKAVDLGGNGATDKEQRKTEILEENVALRVAAAQREAELLAGIEAGMRDESIKIATDRNNQLNEIDKKKAELDQINRDLARTNINASEQSILEMKRSAAEQELVILEEKFSLTQAKTAEQEAQDVEARIAAKQILNEALTEQETIFLEEKRARDEEERAIDIEIKTAQSEEDLLFLQNQLITEQEAKNVVRQEDLKRMAAAQNTKLKNEARFGKEVGSMHTFFQSEEVKGVQSTLGMIGQIKTKEGSKAGEAQKAFAMADAAIKIPQAAFSAYTAMVGIPFVGPVLAPIAAAAAVAVGTQNLNSIRSAKTPSYAVGTDYVPSDMMANIHAGEAIIPAKQNQFLQSGDLVLGSPDAVSNGGGSTNIINLNFEGANFVGNVGDDDQFINQVFEGIAVGINEGRLPGFESATLAVTR